MGFTERHTLGSQGQRGGEEGEEGEGEVEGKSVQSMVPADDVEAHRAAHGVGDDVETPLCHWSLDFQCLTVKPEIDGRIVNVSQQESEE